MSMINIKTISGNYFGTMAQKQLNKGGNRVN